MFARWFQKKDQSSEDASSQADDAHYCVGIDLGTTHCTMAYKPLVQESKIELFGIKQFVQPGQLQTSTLLPSFLYLPDDQEFHQDEYTMPWQTEKRAVGILARKLGVSAPYKCVQSAKSWLSQKAIDARDPALPLHGKVQLSPFEAVVHYLDFLKHSWNETFPDAPLEKQHVTITVPASFDPKARELTVDAAFTVGLTQAVLLEEPQSATYSWLSTHAKTWRQYIKVDETILVLDLGGGTTDISLIKAVDSGGDLSLERVAVGSHILLGGDNMDLTLAYTVFAKVRQQGVTLEQWQIQGMTQACRKAKETLLNHPELNEVSVTIPARGTELVGNALHASLTQADIEASLLNGFFPDVDLQTITLTQPRTGLQTSGLDYAKDPAVTKHLGLFIQKHLNGKAPTHILFNGGVFNATVLKDKIMSQLSKWFEQPVNEITDIDLDHAVAVGASYHAFINHHNEGGIKIKGGASNTYYVGIETPMPAIPGFEPPVDALCILPKGTEQEQNCHSNFQCQIYVGETARFRFFQSSTREDSVDSLIPDWEMKDIEELNQVEVVLPHDTLPVGSLVNVNINAKLSELGVIELEAESVDTRDKWRIELDIHQTQSVALKAVAC